MILSIVQIGNSRGIRLPKAVLEQCRITDKVELGPKSKWRRLKSLYEFHALGLTKGPFA